MPTFKGTVDFVTTFTVVAEDRDQAHEFIMEAVEAETDPGMFDSVKIKDIVEIK